MQQSLNPVENGGNHAEVKIADRTANHSDMGLVAILLAGVNRASFAQDRNGPAYVPPSIKAEDVLARARRKSGSFSASVIFPGTVRNVSVFIPARINKVQASLRLRQDRRL